MKSASLTRLYEYRLGSVDERVGIIISMPIEVFHTRDQNHVTAGAAPFWGSSFATAPVAAVDMI